MSELSVLPFLGSVVPPMSLSTQPRLTHALGAAVAASVVVSASWVVDQTGWPVWLTLWAVGVLAVTLGQALAGALAARIMACLNRAARALARRRAQRRMWAHARKDPRLLQRLTQSFPEAADPVTATRAAPPRRVPLPYL